jgi:3-oxoacyl-[acyl-carrier-protein] synthase II
MSGREQAPVAIIGMSARVPGADDSEALWRLLVAGRQTMRPVDQRHLYDYQPDLVGADQPTLSRFNTVREFEPALFGLTRRMASWMDPQQRLMLEAAWQALESAGVAPASIAGQDVGVFVSTTCSDMRDLMAARHLADRYSAVGLLLTMVSSRISQQFDLRGPSITLDTACAGGLTAVSQAVSGLRAGDFRMALAGSPNYYMHGYMHAVMQRFGALSPTGIASCFGAAADGYARGEGVFCFVLKLLSDAIADGDPILAVIQAAALGHDGRRGGVTKSDAGSQIELIQRALDQADLTPSSYGYVEAHAAGTPKGDPIEVQALVQLVRGAAGPAAVAGGPDGKLWMGSIKGNIGHLEGAAGSASLAKAVQILRYAAIPPTPAVTALHPDVPNDRHPIDIATKYLEWSDREPRYVGVNAFGVGGANAHVILQSAPAGVAFDVQPSTAWLVPISARTTTSLGALANGLANLVEAGSPDFSSKSSSVPADLASFVWTLQSGRAQLAHRLLLVVRTPAEFVEAARSAALGKPHPAVLSGTPTQPFNGVISGDLTAIEQDVARRWLDGDVVDWNPLWPGPARPRRVHLVPYPFDRSLCWPAGDLDDIS